MQFKVRYSGVDSTYYFLEGGVLIPFTKLSTKSNSDGSKTDTIQVAVSKLGVNNNGDYHYTNPICIKSYSGATAVYSLNISPKWAM